MSALAEKRIVITRALPQAPALAKLLEEKGATVIAIPAIEIVPPQSFQPLDKALKKIQSYDWLILTSANGVTALRKRMEKAGIDPGLLRPIRICAIGPATKSEIERQLGLKVAFMPEEYVAESVVAVLRRQVAGQNVLLVRAKVTRDVIPNELRKAGAEVDVAEAYETVLPVNSAAKLQELLEGKRADAITFTSSSTARNFVALLPQGKSPKELLQGLALASIGPVTSKTLREVGLWVDIEAETYTMEGLVASLERYFSRGATA
jgi:uroporphyrinogen-III synthase